MFVPVEPKVLEPNSAIAIILKFSINIFLAFEYIFPLVSIELGTIIPATPSDFKSCFALSRKNSSILLFLSKLSTSLLKRYFFL